MKVEVEGEVITEIRNGLQLILTNVESILRKEWSYYADRVINQVKRIDKLLPEVKLEDCPVCHGQGSTTDHHDPCTECGGSGKVGGRNHENNKEK